jgi:hypothetical protein
MDMSSFVSHPLANITKFSIARIKWDSALARKELGSCHSMLTRRKVTAEGQQLLFYPSDNGR